MMASVYRVLLALSFCAVLEASADTRPPNIVLVIGDDQGWTDYGFMGHDTIRTPHLDKLAAEGLVFPRGYVVSSLCRPSLATLATGLYPHQHGITGNDPKGLPGDRGLLEEPWRAQFKTLPRVAELLGGAGYTSHQSGKWWEGPCLCGGFTAGMTHGDPARGGRHGDEGLLIGREGMKPVFDFIDAAKEQPFFVWYAPFLPHTPHNPPERLLEKYRADGRPEELATYYAMCEWFDETVGQLMAHIEARGLTDNTLVVFLNDNGWIQPTPDRPAAARPSQGAPRGKGSPNEGGVRTPVVLHWPGRIAPGVVNTPVSSIDIVPTVLKAAGVAVPDNLPGLNLLDTAAVNARPAVFGAVFEHDMTAPDQPSATLQWRYIVRGTDKLILPTDRVKDSAELFNLATDPHEHTNLSGRSPEALQELTALLNTWWKP